MIFKEYATYEYVDNAIASKSNGTILTITDIGEGIASHSATEIVDCIRNGGLAVFRMGGAESGDYAYYVGAHEGNLVTFELMVNMASDGMGQHMIVNINVDADKNITYVEEGTMSGVASVNGKTGAVELTASDVGAIPTPNTAEVGQTIRVSEVDENGKPVAWEAVNFPKWRYLGRVTTEEELARLEMTVDSDGNPFSVTRLILQGLVTPNSSGNTGWVKPFINGKAWPLSLGVTGLAVSDGVIGRSFRWEFEIIDGILMAKSGMKSINTTTVYHLLSANDSGGSYFESDRLDNPIEANSITTVLFQGYQSPILGAGSYIECWGVDA